ncbi:MAG: permease-like cell division protein FtsX [Oscillospiraceae bacterium]|nr:permease-like cell division protein FtsX [Oscillospiraceae bacterium]
MRLYNISYFLREGIHSIFTHRLLSFAAMGVITACLLLMGSFSLVAVNIESVLEDVENKNEIVAYVDETFSEDAARAIEYEIEEIDEITEITFTTKDEALESFKESFGDESELLDGLDSRNPLRDRYTVKIEDIRKTRDVAEKLRAVEGIAKVSERSDISEKIVQVRDGATAICVVLILILMFVSVFIISNIVNLTMFNRREEIAIMKMIGATNGFIRFPFVIEGLLIGISGAVLALLLQWAVYEYVVAGALSSISFFETVPFGSAAGGIALMFFATAVLVGGLGSAITLRKFLKV